MKQILKHQNLPWLTLFCGGIGLLLRVWLLSTENDKGFITRWHISEILLTLLSLLFLGVLYLATRGLQQGNKYKFNFPASLTGGIGAAIAGFCVALTSVAELSVGVAKLELACAWVGLLAAACFLFVAYCRWKGLHPSMLFHTFICCWLVLRLICLYRSWSSDPQLEDYCYQLLALVFAMISAYHRAAFDAKMGQRASHAFFSLACVYCCILSIAGPDGIVLYLGLGIWQFTDVCRLTPMPRRYRGKKNEAA